MTKNKVNEAIELIQMMLTRFWQRDYKTILKYLSDDVMLVGALQEQFVKGIDNVEEILRRTTMQMPMSHLMEQEFFVVQNCGATCTIVGKYLTTNDDSNDYFLQRQQRCTHVLELAEGELKVKHVHISNPYGQMSLREGELVPNTLGKMATEYYLRKARSLCDSRRLLVKSRENTVHILSYAEIMYVSAFGREIEIYTDGGKVVTAKMGISDFMKETNGAFIPIHRSYAVHPMYVSRIQPFHVTLSDETKLPVPAKRYTEIKERLLDGISSYSEVNE